jgi:hypothetical protein
MNGLRWTGAVKTQEMREFEEQYLNKPDVVPPTHTADGKLTREGALVEARKKWGELGMISSPSLPPVVWCIGRFKETVGRGRTWEEALARSKK